MRSLIASVRKKGVRQSLRIYAHKTRNRVKAFISDWIFEIRYATRTRSIVPLNGLCIESENRSQGVHYEPTRIFILKAVFDCLDVEFPKCGIVDFGCGKGRVLVFAAAQGFGNVTGVEFARELCEHSRSNLSAFAQKTGRRFRYNVLNIDAAVYQTRPQDNVFFFFNPFGEKVLTRVLDNIDQARNRQEAFFIYVNPVHRSVFSGRYRTIRHIENHEAAYNAVIYKKERR